MVRHRLSIGTVSLFPFTPCSRSLRPHRGTTALDRVPLEFDDWLIIGFDPKYRVAIVESLFLYNASWERSVEDAKKRNASA